MHFSFYDLNGHKVTGQCKEFLYSVANTDSSIKKEIQNSTVLEAIIGEMEFYEKLDQSQAIPAHRFAVDNEGNVFDSDHLPDLTALGSQWKTED